MARGSKAAYTDKQKRKAAHIKNGYERRGVSEEEAEKRAWATVNRDSGGGKKSGSGRGKKESHVSSAKAGRSGAAAKKKSTPGAKRKPAPKTNTSQKKTK